MQDFFKKVEAELLVSFTAIVFFFLITQYALQQ